MVETREGGIGLDSKLDLDIVPHEEGFSGHSWVLGFVPFIARPQVLRLTQNMVMNCISIHFITIHSVIDY
jgi:hypothetical protein